MANVELEIQNEQTRQEGSFTVAEDSTPPANAVDALPKWNDSKVNTYKTIATFLGFTVAGLNDAVYGAIIPYLEEYYKISYTVVSLVFLSPLVGYISAATLSNMIHQRLGQRGIAFIGPGSHLLAYVVICLHPPYPVLVIAFIAAGFGNGILDAAWNAWLGNMANANQVLGFLHGFYGLGATISPLIATTMVTKGGLKWYTFYYIMIAAATLELATSVMAFWNETATKFRAQNPPSADAKTGVTREALKQRVTWVSAVFLLTYVGIEVALGGWIVTFMIRVRNGEAFASGMSATGFWLGITVGRTVLGFVTPRVGVDLAIPLYLVLSVVCHVLFWFIPSFIASSIWVAFLGFFLGPLFPAAIVATTRRLPRNLHIGAIGFGAAFGGGGACILPFAVGALAQSKGVEVLQPIILCMLVLASLLWIVGMPQGGGVEGEGQLTKGAARFIERVWTRAHTSRSSNL